jgi:hypothetical protein
MRVRNALAVISVVIATGLTCYSPAEARGCRRAFPGWCGRQAAVAHYLYVPAYRNEYYVAPVVGPDPYPYPYMPRGYWSRGNNPFWSYSAAYWYPNWWPNRPRFVAVPAPMPVPVDCIRCRRPLK